MSLAAADIAEWRRWIGRSEVRQETLDPEALRRYAAALGEELEVERTVPSLGHWAFFLPVAPASALGPDGHPARGGFLPPVSLPRRMFSAAVMDFAAPLLLGRPAQRVSTVLDVAHKAGRSGDLVLIEVEHRVVQQEQDRVVERQTLIYRDAGASAPPPGPAVEPAPGDARWTPGSVELFRFSAATFNGHRIHYDQPYATTVEGYPGLVVHGPLTAARLFRLAMAEAAPRRFEFRATAPLFVGQPVWLRRNGEGVAAVRVDGVTAMTARATRVIGGALDGVRVLDLSRVLAGPWSTQILADLGADVLKVEHPGRGDDTRAWGPPYLTGADGAEERGESAYYLCANRNKRSVAIDFSTPEGGAVVRDLAARADVLVENFKPGGLAKYGLDHASLAAINPRLVTCSITGFGQTGPYAERGGYDFVVQGMGGFMSITGEADGPPLRAGVAMADLSTGMYATVSILAALRHAERSGIGQQIDLSLLDTQIAMLANQAMNWLVGGINPGRLGNRHPTVVPYKTFEVADGMIIIAVGNDGQFRLLCRELGLAQVASDPRFATARLRQINRDAIEAIVQEAVIGEAGAALIERLTARGVPAGPVNTIRELFDDPFVEARGTVHRFVRDDGVEIPSVAFPAKLSLTPATYRRAPPRVGEHGHEALAHWLGLGAEQLAALEAAGALAQSAQ